MTRGKPDDAEIELDSINYGIRGLQALASIVKDVDGRSEAQDLLLEHWNTNSCQRLYIQSS
jgi:hypothetical protein